MFGRGGFPMYIAQEAARRGFAGGEEVSKRPLSGKGDGRVICETTIGGSHGLANCAFDCYIR